MPLVNCKISLILTWLGNRVITDSKTTGTFEIIDTKLYIPVVNFVNSRQYKTIATI